MAIPSLERLINDVIGLMSDGQIRKRDTIISEVRQRLIKSGEVSIDEANEKLKKTGQNRLNNRISWAVSHLYKAGLIERVGRAQYKITERGAEAYNKLGKIDFNYLRSIPEYAEWLSSLRLTQREEDSQADSTLVVAQSLEEELERIYKEIYQTIKEDLLDLIRNIDPYKFEKVLLELLRKMGYGEPRITARTKDGGIDGVIMADRFGFDEVYIQAKRWSSNKVGSDTVNNFIGALTRRGASAGVLITTSDFTEDAKKAVEEVRSRGLKIVLINGERLAELLIEYNVGVYVKYTYEVKAIDENFFEEV